MTVTEVCLIIITTILVVRSLVELKIVIQLAKKLTPILNSLNQVTNNLKDITQFAKEEGIHIKDTIHEFTKDTKLRVDIFKKTLNRVNENLFIFNSFLNVFIQFFNSFMKKGDKENSETGD